MAAAGISGTAYLLMAALLAGWLAAPAAAGERKRLNLPKHVSEQRVLQLSPGSGVNPGYHRPALVKPYQPEAVIFTGKVPVAVKPKDKDQLQPTGSFSGTRSFVSGPPGFKP
ncbi:hypothetical protein FPY71_01720 [Aureimonas fodinaquatilis]|uniref:Uncharacterized protein n=1 Tax=Aureimonas fodinaquatilis TaxID=2565783 RepID=A0A5B0E0Q4_9HYPH|nr:hypothetical protein [Aureimonas fodinaquatilis]KAA0971872.1 hypothetical protein FPY71_01720 [Aureimonas fodinaquatilis]